MRNANAVLQYEGQDRDDEAVDEGLVKEADGDGANDEQVVCSPGQPKWLPGKISSIVNRATAREFSHYCKHRVLVMLDETAVR